MQPTTEGRNPPALLAAIQSVVRINGVQGMSLVVSAISFSTLGMFDHSACEKVEGETGISFPFFACVTIALVVGGSPWSIGARDEGKEGRAMVCRQTGQRLLLHKPSRQAPPQAPR